MAKRGDPFLSTRYRLCTILLNWPAIVAVLLILAAVVAFDAFKVTGQGEIVTGTVVRVEVVGKSTEWRTLVRLSNGTQMTVHLPTRTNCHTGSTIRLLVRTNVAGRSYQPALNACDNGD